MKYKKIRRVSSEDGARFLVLDALFTCSLTTVGILAKLSYSNTVGTEGFSTVPTVFRTR